MLPTRDYPSNKDDERGRQEHCAREKLNYSPFRFMVGRRKAERRTSKFGGSHRLICVSIGELNRKGIHRGCILVH